ncbi:restriction endonuclease subunit S [Citromicrobium bathyomarinum]
MSWPTVALGDLFEIARGGSPRPIEKFLTDDPDGLNWISISDATQSGKVIEKTERRIRKEGLAKSRWVEPGDFLLSNSMSFGRPYIMGTAGCIHDGWLVLKPGKTEVDSNYLYHLLGSQPVFAQFTKRATGTTVKNLNTTIVSETEIPLPPLPEQQRIAAILDQADALRGLRRQSLSRLSDLGQAIFYEMFGDPIANTKQFPTSRLASFGTLDRGKSKHRPRNDPVLLGGPHPLIQTGDVAGARDFITSFQSTYSDVGLKQSRKWPRGTLCITIAANIADTAILDFDACFPDSIVGFQSGSDATNYFIHEWFTRLSPRRM